MRWSGDAPEIYLTIQSLQKFIKLDDEKSNIYRAYNARVVLGLWGSYLIGLAYPMSTSRSYLIKTMSKPINSRPINYKSFYSIIVMN